MIHGYYVNLISFLNLFLAVTRNEVFWLLFCFCSIITLQELNRKKKMTHKQVAHVGNDAECDSEGKLYTVIWLFITRRTEQNWKVPSNHIWMMEIHFAVTNCIHNRYSKIFLEKYAIAMAEVKTLHHCYSSTNGNHAASLK